MGDSKEFGYLIDAIKASDVDGAMKAISRGANVNETIDGYVCPLALAIGIGNMEVVELLLKSDAEINYRNVIAPIPAPFMHAISINSTEAVELLIRYGANVDRKGRDKLPLQVATRNGNIEIVRMLLNGDAYTECVDELNNTPLYDAVLHGYVEIVDLLISKRASVNAHCKNSNTPLYTAALQGNMEIIDLLISKGALINAKCQNDKIPLHAAAAQGNIMAMEMLVENGSDIDSKDSAGNTPLYLSVREGQNEAVDLLLRNTAIVNTHNETGDTPLHAALMQCQKGNVEQLVTYGADVNICDQLGNTPLHYAVKYCDIGTIKLLIAHGAEVNSSNKSGSVPIQLAVLHGNERAIEVLIENGASLSHLGKDKASRLIKRGITTNALVAQGDLKAVGELNKDTITSTKQFIEKNAVKVVLIGQTGAGKTSLLRTVQQQKATLTDAAESTVGVELTVVHVPVDPNILCYMYDFGGQEDYVPLHQVLITPHSLFPLIIDLEDFEKNMDNEEFFKANIGHFYFTFSQRVLSPVLQVVGTKSDRLSTEQIDECKKKILEKLQDFEDTEKHILEKRKDDLNDSLQDENRIYGLSNQELEDKIAVVQNLLDNRPILPKDVIVVSSKNFDGIKEWMEDIKEQVERHTNKFPSMSLPQTWLSLSDTLSAMKGDNSISVNLDEFKDICKSFGITKQEEIDGVVHHLRIIGQILFYENNIKLKDVIFINPEKVLNSLSAVYSHEHKEDTFWNENKKMQVLQKSHRSLFQGHGIASKSLMHTFLQTKGIESKFGSFIDLMVQINLCFKLLHNDSNLELVDEENYIIPSLLKDKTSTQMEEMWPSTPQNGINEIKLALDLATQITPDGIFEKISACINPHLKRRYDRAKCTIAEFNEFGDTFKFDMETKESGPRMVMSIRHGAGRHGTASDFTKIILIQIIDVLSDFPTIPWEIFTLCTLCEKVRSTDCHLLPVDVCLFSNRDIGSTHSCRQCHGRYDVKTGLPITKEYMDGLCKTLQALVTRHIGREWRFLAREIFPSLYQADDSITEIMMELGPERRSQGVSREIEEGNSEDVGNRKESKSKRTVRQGGARFENMKRGEYFRHREGSKSKRTIRQDGGRSEKKNVDHTSGSQHSNISVEITEENTEEKTKRLLQRWEEVCGNDDASYNVLLTALSSLGRRDIIDKMRIGNQDVRYAEDAVMKSIRRGHTIRAVSKLIVLLTSLEMKSGWRQLYRKLESALKDSDTVVIGQDYRNVREQAYRMLTKWIRDNSEGATIQALANGLKSDYVDRGDIAEKIRDVCKRYKVESSQRLQL